MIKWLKKIFGTHQMRTISKYQKIVQKIHEEEKKLESLTDDELKAKTPYFQKKIAEGESLDSLLPEAYAVVKNVCRRLKGTQIHVSGYDQEWDMVPYDVQLIGGIAMHYGSIAEMQTGEGKTLTASLPLYLNALTKKPVHLVTVNDYLAQRDCEWVGTIFRWLGLNVQVLNHQTPPQARKGIYEADIVYGTASEFGFDYLRDNSMAMNASDQCQRGHYFAIIDEIDSILIDEARTPLIISGPAAQSRQMYDVLKTPVETLVRMQRDLCNKMATEAKKVLDQFDQFNEQEKKKLPKEDDLLVKKALRKLWQVSKGFPTHKILKRVKEHPDLRAELEKLDVYFYGEQNKEERQEALSELYMIVDERGNEYELTDRGISAWEESGNSSKDFVMMDLGLEYAHIDNDIQLTEEQKLQKKVSLREQDAERKERAHNLRQLLRAHLLMERDVDYIVAEEKIVIIDENTGRPQPGRRFSDGLHQAIEAKENLTIQGETQTYATVTLQNYFRLYSKLAGMTGTALTEAGEFKEIYKLDVLAIPSHRPCIRKDGNDEIYMTEREKYSSLLKEIQEVHAQGRPILIGTESVDVSEKISRILKLNNLEHSVLNAKNHAKEAEIIAGAGRKGAITVATNMAGRGTDIKLDKEVIEFGGLHVIGTTRHTSRRIDRQLRGRCARLGDPGTSHFFVSFEDSLLRLFASPRITAFLQRFRPPEGEPISAKVLNKSIETAQKRVEERNYQMRKHTLEYDDVINKQRLEIYTFRNEVLCKEDILTLVKEVLESLCREKGSEFLKDKTSEKGWNPLHYREWLMEHIPLTFELKDFEDEYLSKEEIEERVIQKVLAVFDQKVAHDIEKIAQAQSESEGNSSTLGAQEVVMRILRNILIRILDSHWQRHLLKIDYLRSEMQMRVIGQKDPLLEFKHEAFNLFARLTTTIKEEIAHALFKFQIRLGESRPSSVKPPNREGKVVEFRASLSSMS